MTVTEVKNPQDFSYEMTTDATTGRSTYAMRWVVDTDDQDQSPVSVATQAQSLVSGFTNPLPARWSTYDHNGDQDDNAYLKGGLRMYKPDPANLPTRWYVEGTYEPLAPGQSAGDSAATPTSRPERYRIESEPYSRIVIEDKDGQPIQNAAKQDFTEPPEEEGFRDVEVIIVNVGTLAEIRTLNSTYRYSVNSTTYGTAAPRTAKIDNVEAGDKITEGDNEYYQAVIRITYSDKPWDLKLVNQGFLHYDKPLNDGGKLVRAVDKEGKETPEPVLLKEDGTRLAEGETGNYITARVRREVDYNNILGP